jgi:hypothetical protein
MSAILLDDFRQRSQTTEQTLPRTLAIAKIAAATAIANSLANRVFGHAIESISTDGSDVVIRVFRHGLSQSGKVYLTGTGAAGLTGAVSYTRIDADSIRVAGVTVAETIEGQGLLAVPRTIDLEIVSNMMRIKPGPVAAIEDIRIRSTSWEELGAFPDSAIVPTNEYLLAKDGPNCWSGEVEFSRALSTVVMERRPGYIRPVRSRIRRIARANYYAGVVDVMPDDLIDAISAFAKGLATDPLADKASESYEYYSYSRLTADEQKKLPTSAIATILRYRTK